MGDKASASREKLSLLRLSAQEEQYLENKELFWMNEEYRSQINMLKSVINAQRELIDRLKRQISG